MRKPEQKENSADASSEGKHDSKPTRDTITQRLDETDRCILQVLQDDFPVTPKPWLEISRRLHISEAEVLRRLKRLISAGVVLKVAPFLDSSAVGLKAATLVAFRVPKNRVDQVASVINRYENVSHNYERDHEFNVWFTLTAPTQEDLALTLEEIKQKAGVQAGDVLDLPTVQRFKINVRFQLTG